MMIFMRIQKLLYFFFFHRLLKRILGKYHKLHHKKNCLFHFCFLFAPDIREFLEEKERIKKRDEKGEKEEREDIRSIPSYALTACKKLEEFKKTHKMNETEKMRP
jgi:hypothetical protein